MFGERITVTEDNNKPTGEHRCEGLWCNYCPLSLLDSFTPHKECCPEYYTKRIDIDQHNIFEALSELNIDFDSKEIDVLKIYLQAYLQAHATQKEIMARHDSEEGV